MSIHSITKSNFTIYWSNDVPGDDSIAALIKETIIAAELIQKVIDFFRERPSMMCAINCKNPDRLLSVCLSVEEYETWPKFVIGNIIYFMPKLTFICQSSGLGYSGYDLNQTKKFEEVIPILNPEKGQKLIYRTHRTMDTTMLKIYGESMGYQVSQNGLLVTFHNI